MNAPAPNTDSPVNRVSLRVKLTLWMICIFLVVQLSLALVFQLFQARSIETFFNDRLAARVGDVARKIQADLPGVSDERLRQLCAEQAQLLATDEFTLSVLNARGEVVAASRAPGVMLPPGLLEQAQATPRPFALGLSSDALRSTSRSGEPVRGAMTHVVGRDGAMYHIVIANSDAYAQQMLSFLSNILLISIPIGLVASGVSAYLIAGIAVRPLTALTAAAKQLSPESIGRHVELPAASSEVVAVRRELELARQRIEAGFATQERFMSNVSHELKTPIATILTEIQTLKLHDTPQRVRDFLKSETEELEKLAQTVDSFLLLTRVRHGKAQIPASATCHIRDVMLESYASCISTARQHNVRIDLQLPEGEHEDAAVIGNCDLLKVIFDNILRNAIRFSPAESIITLSAQVQDDKHLHIMVRDRGAGIPPDVLPRIFDRFAQAKSEERRGRGHGLGLEIALGVAELHSGSISVRNCDDVGCEFTVRLPMAPGTSCECPIETKA